MAVGARVDSTDALKTLRAALIKFGEVGNVAISSADSDIDRTLGWMERDQATYWVMQYRKRTEEVAKAEDAVRQKRLFKGADGSVQSAVDEMKALAIAKRRKDEAEAKINSVKKAIGILKKEGQLYRGRIQRLSTMLQADLPMAVHRLDNYLAHIEAYLAIQTTGGGIAPTLGGDAFGGAAGVSGYKTVIEKLRESTPTPEEREAAPLMKINGSIDRPFDAWGAGAVLDWQRTAFGKLSIERTPIDSNEKIVARKDAWLAGKIYVDRRTPAFEGDSGWYLGPAEAVEGDAEYIAFRAGDLLAARPDLADVLSLPAGFLVVTDSGGLSAAVDAMGLDVWAVAMIEAAPPEDVAVSPT